MCTSGPLRAERGWVTAVNGAPQVELGFHHVELSLEEWHEQAAV